MSDKMTIKVPNPTDEDELTKKMIAEAKGTPHHYTKDTKKEQNFNDDPDYIRIDNLPSKFIPYNFSSIWFRPLKVGDWVKITQAVVHQNVTSFLDALDPSISIPIRDLCYQDFVWFMYRQRLESFPNSPINVTWVSKYGNTNELQINSAPETIYFSLNQEEYTKIFGVTFRMPNVRDYEVIESKLLDPEKELLYKQVQYFQTSIQFDSEKDEIRNFISKSVEWMKDRKLSELQELSKIKKLMAFGVNQELQLIDKHYTIEGWVQKIKEAIKLEKNSEYPNQDTVDFLLQSLSDIEEKKEKGEDLSKPDKEVVTHEFSPWGFFPDLEE